MSADDDPTSDQRQGEILKGAAPGQDQIAIGMDVTSLDGQRLGKVKQVSADEFLLDRPLARDLWVPFRFILAAEDYSGNYHGPVQPTELVLSVSSSHIDSMRWRHG
ncbi:MAG TPA: hypothetical protein VF937_14960 [Chloroflexota bacterium]